MILFQFHHNQFLSVQQSNHNTSWIGEGGGGGGGGGEGGESVIICHNKFNFYYIARI